MASNYHRQKIPLCTECDEVLVMVKRDLVETAKKIREEGHAVTFAQLREVGEALADVIEAKKEQARN